MHSLYRAVCVSADCTPHMRVRQKVSKTSLDINCRDKKKQAKQTATGLQFFNSLRLKIPLPKKAICENPWYTVETAYMKIFFIV